MAQGTVTVFDSYIEYSFKGSPDCPFDLGATPDVFKCAIIDNTITPATDDPDPCYGTGGSTNFEPGKQEGGSFTAGGLALATPVVSVVGGVPQLDFGDPAQWAKNAANPTACWYGLIYDDTTANKNCVGWVDLGGVFDATTGPLDIAWGAPFMTADQA
jgi:hypothetical protein